MPLSRYLKIFPHPADPAQRVVFSSRTAAAVSVPASLLADAERGTLPEAERRTLARLGMLVADREAERAEILGFLDAIGREARALHAVVVMNLDCNLACTYCFEGSRRGRRYLSEDTGRELLSFLRRHRLPGQEKIDLTFYGGEPLLSLAHIERIARGVGEMAAEDGLGFTFALVTNGTLLTREAVRRLRPLGLASASVTLDGPREIHDAQRPFRGHPPPSPRGRGGPGHASPSRGEGGVGVARGTYDVVLRNVRDVAREVPLLVGGNFLRENWREFPRLLDDLAAAGVGPDVVPDVRFDPVFRERDGVVPPDFRGGCCSSNEPWLAEATVALRAALISRGYRPARLAPAPCMVDLPHRIVVGVDGSLCKCPGLLGRPEFRVGSLAGGIGDYRESHRLDSWKNDECLACAYLPLCFGGCRYLAFLRDGALDGVDCRKPFFDAALERLVMQDLGLPPGGQPT